MENKIFGKMSPISLIKALILLSCLLFIGFTILYFTHSLGNLRWLNPIIKPILKIISFTIPYLVKLVLFSITTLWIPVIIYLLISIVTTSYWWRALLCIVSLCGLLLGFQMIVLSHLSITTVFQNVFQVIIYLTNIYLLILWMTPKEVWNWIGGSLWFIYSAIVAIMPDLPGSLDDFGIIAAIFAFIFLYLHTLANLVKSFGDSPLILSIHNRLVAFLHLNNSV